MKLFSLFLVCHTITAVSKFHRALYAVSKKNRKKKTLSEHKNEKKLSNIRKKQWRSVQCVVDNGSGFNMGGNNYFVQCNAGYCASSAVTIVTCSKGSGFSPPFACEVCQAETETTMATTTAKTKPPKPTKPPKKTKPSATTEPLIPTVPSIPTVPGKNLFHK